MFANAPDAAPPRRRAGGRAAPRRRRGARPARTATASEVGNERGSFAAPCSLSGDAARRGVAATTKGHWPKLLAGGENINAATEERDADLGGGAVFHDCAVWVRAGVA